MAREEGNRYVVVGEDVNRRGRVSPGCERVEGCDWDETLEGLEAGAADYGDTNGIWGWVSSESGDLGSGGGKEMGEVERVEGYMR